MLYILPTIIDQISDLTTSMFKNAVTNQKINGAQCVFSFLIFGY